MAPTSFMSFLSWQSHMARRCSGVVPARRAKLSKYFLRHDYLVTNFKLMKVFLIA